MNTARLKQTLASGIFTLLLLVLALAGRANAPQRGSDRLRELVVLPTINLSFYIGMDFQINQWVIHENEDLLEKITRLRDEVNRHPDDIDLLLRLGNALDQNGQTNESKTCFLVAEKLCRKRIAARPQDGSSMTKLGVALNELGRVDEAEHALRNATLIASNDWRCWTSLGNFLGNKPVQMFPESLRRRFSFSQAPREILDYRPSGEMLVSAETSCNEASRCFDRAVTLAPKAPAMFIQRAGYLSMSNWYGCFFRHIRNNDKIEPKNLLIAFFSDETSDSLQKAAAIETKDYQLTGAAAYFEMVNQMLQGNFTNGFKLDLLPVKSRQTIQTSMTRLENLAQGSDTKVAAGALENLGFLYVFLKDESRAVDCLRRAVALDPTREQSWNGLLGLLAGTATPSELLAICQSRLKAKDSARNHLVLAKQFAKMGKWSEACEQANTVGKLETNNVIAPLMLAAVALKQSADTNQLSVATDNLRRTAELLQKMPDSEEKLAHWRELLLNLAIATNLEGSADSLEYSRRCLRAVLSSNPDDEDARNILSALN